MFSKILIANRGEIAIRVMRACKELGVKTVAVYSEADSHALHVQFADEAILLGASAPRESYLNIEKIISAAKQTGAEAIHPGYGFLSENAAFADAVTAAGLTFIGPSASAIRLMGDKAGAKAMMKQAGVPTVPGREALGSDKDFKKAAKEIGYPLLVKAAAGGGGKGMRVVERESELGEAVEGARREALNAFGDERLIVEKYVPDAHHIEFQVFGDGHRNLVHLFERECSVQRRYQKIVEETPSPLLTDELRARMGAAAVSVANAVGYTNAGTVEFIVDRATLDYYFLEMNTRLQVEHPVTEAAVGLDLVQWQIRVAAGEVFPYAQADLSQRGHAIECRVYAEDPASGFLPSTGKLLQYVEPRGPGIRVDSGFAIGDELTHFYDPLLAKVIVHAEDREAAIQRMQAALGGYVVHGVVTNVDFLQDLLAHNDFKNGAVATRWVETKFSWAPAGHAFEMLVAAALAEVSVSSVKNVSSVKYQVSGSDERDPYSPWKASSGFRN
ncbi:MAG TPA: acetyl-CoA carboxylase biotin carboxylase subunit [Anaerolineales bacterium]|jgi:acetyl-CoA carboxylase biotin carboxylase subunit